VGQQCRLAVVVSPTAGAIIHRYRQMNARCCHMRATANPRRSDSIPWQLRAPPREEPKDHRSNTVSESLRRSCGGGKPCFCMTLKDCFVFPQEYEARIRTSAGFSRYAAGHERP
jgi:hypothetical protein